MNIRVMYTGHLRMQTKIAAESLEVNEGGTLGDLLQLVVRRHGNQASGKLFVLDGQRVLCIVLRNGRPERSLGTPLANGDQVHLVVPLTGG